MVKQRDYELEIDTGNLVGRDRRLFYIISPDYDKEVTKYTVSFSCEGKGYPDKTVAELGLYGALPLPEREGYEFLGWYTSKEYNKDAYFDIYNTPVVGKTGDVLTLYAHWRKWDENVAQGGNKVDKYKTEYYTEKVWIGDQNVPENPYPSGEFAVNDAAPIVVTPDESQPDGDGLPPWLIVVIIVAAVVIVGGGATLAAILLKKKKS